MGHNGRLARHSLDPLASLTQPVGAVRLNGSNHASTSLVDDCELAVQLGVASTTA
jgi:hypothetical protein